MEDKSEIILYQPEETFKLEVRLENETVWLTQQQMAELFDVKENTITYHIKEIYHIGELEAIPTTRKIRVVRQEGNRKVNRNIDFYNLDMIISVGYRVSSKRGIQFRQWANKILKEYLLKGYSINQRLHTIEQKIDNRISEHEQRLNQIDRKIDFFVRAALPPIEGIFFEGQIFDAYVFATNLIKSAKKEIILIDNYVDENTLMILSKRQKGVEATVYTSKLNKQLQLDLQRHDAEYPPIIIRECKQSHDRFLILDSEVFHIGASLKDLGKKWFAFSKLHFAPQDLLKRINNNNINQSYTQNDKQRT